MRISNLAKLTPKIGALALLLTTLTAINTSVASAAVSDIKVNEVESSGGSPGDWVELYNSGSATVDISGLKFVDNDNTRTQYSIPAATTLAAGAFYTIDEATFGFGLGSADSARLFATDGTTIIDSYTWTAHASTTYGRCPDGSGSFATTAASTKGLANSCGASATTTTSTTTTLVPGLTWPGDAAVQTVDVANTFSSNLSGLDYEGSGTATPGVLWATRNGPGAMFRMVYNGANWVPDTTNDWGSGKLLRYTDGTGDVDAEGVTMGGTASTDGLYVSAERNNSANSVSRNSILRYDVSAAGSTLTATNEWNLTADLPVNTANTGFETISWIPDSYLTAQGFLDESTGSTYNPANYANHGAGLFVVGVEATGKLYVYALDAVGGGFTRIATINSGFIGVMGTEFDQDLNNLWVVCDDGCAGRSAVFNVDAVTKKFTITNMYERPASMPNINNEGFAIAAATECVDNRKPAFWADDASTAGNAIRSGNVPCSNTVMPPPVVPEFPLGALSAAAVTLLALGALWVLHGRRNGVTV
jgi:hypothetical protein